MSPESAEWEGLIATFADFAYRYGFSLLVSPIFEEVGVFNRGIGENSEMAKKEMYVFEDRGEIEVKGKGRMRTWLIKERRGDVLVDRNSLVA